MKPEHASQSLLGATRAKAKMYEYGVPIEHHNINISRDPSKLFRLAIALLGDMSAQSNRGQTPTADSTLERQRDLTFAARFFDSYMEARLKSDTDAYLLLLASSAFYLCDLPGSSYVLASRVPAQTPDIGGECLETLLRWLLIGAIGDPPQNLDGAFARQLRATAAQVSRFYNVGSNTHELLTQLAELRNAVYAAGTPRELLLADVACAIARKRHANSAWQCIPAFSGLSSELWRPAFQKAGFIRELWPSQRLLGEHGVFRGKSAIVQMPTSAGKTRATELIIRSAFLSGRTSSAVIVAPFRALCREISYSLSEAFQGESITIDELTDALQADFDFDFELDQILESKRVLVVTPEKLVYVLRHSPELAASIGLVIYDEGHQFDSGLRGVTYELLLASLRRQIPKKAQTILISAVISNAEVIGEWLHGPSPTIVSGRNLTPMPRTVAFASWLDQLGQLKFVAEAAPATDDFFVPRVLSRQELTRRPKERKPRYFPEKDDGQSIALYLGTKLVSQGSVAIFCGRKPTAAALCEKITEAYGRDFSQRRPIEYSDNAEVLRLATLYERNLGIESSSTKCAAIGIFSHHGNTPHGIRLAVEHAMKNGSAKFVICTSTLAQGVNLPIRYLIVTSVYQGEERIKVRDFHNLIGRAGRAGMHTEGTIIFADPIVYDKRKDRKDRWRWSQIQELLEPNNSEPVVSMLRTLFEPLKSDDEKVVLRMGPLDFARAYILGSDHVTAFIAANVRAHSDKGFTQKGLVSQAYWRTSIFATIESYLMSYWEESEGNDFVQQLAQGTLAYSMSNDAEKAQLVELFQILADHIRAAVPEAERRKIFGRTLQGLTAILDLEQWVSDNLAALQALPDHERLLRFLWPKLSQGINNSTFKKCEKPELLIEVAIAWISGEPFFQLFDYLRGQDVMLKAGTQRRELKIDHVVDICENAFAYDGALRIGAIADLLSSRADGECEELVAMLNQLHKRFKYGLPFSSAVGLYEYGFADRCVASHLSALIGPAPRTRSRTLELLREMEGRVRTALGAYPGYFETIFENLVR